MKKSKPKQDDLRSSLHNKKCLEIFDALIVHRKNPVLSDTDLKSLVSDIRDNWVDILFEEQYILVTAYFIFVMKNIIHGKSALARRKFNEKYNAILATLFEGYKVWLEKGTDIDAAVRAIKEVNETDVPPLDIILGKSATDESGASKDLLEALIGFIELRNETLTPMLTTPAPSRTVALSTSKTTPATPTPPTFAENVLLRKLKIGTKRSTPSSRYAVVPSPKSLDADGAGRKVKDVLVKHTTETTSPKLKYINEREGSRSGTTKEKRIVEHGDYKIDESEKNFDAKKVYSSLKLDTSKSLNTSFGITKAATGKVQTIEATIPGATGGAIDVAQIFRHDDAAKSEESLIISAKPDAVKLITEFNKKDITAEEAATVLSIMLGIRAVCEEAQVNYLNVDFPTPTGKINDTELERLLVHAECCILEHVIPVFEDSVFKAMLDSFNEMEKKYIREFNDPATGMPKPIAAFNDVDKKKAIASGVNPALYIQGSKILSALDLMRKTATVGLDKLNDAEADSLVKQAMLNMHLPTPFGELAGKRFKP